MDYGYGIAVDSSGNVYVTGSEYITGEWYNIWIRKYDSDGSTNWTKTHNGPANGIDEGKSIAVDSSGNVYVTGRENVAGESYNIWTRKYSPCPPNAPQWISTISISTEQINLIWNDLINETSYTLFRNTVNNTNNATNIVGFPVNVTNYNNTGLSPNTTYYYWLKAYNDIGSSEYSTVASNTTKSNEYNPFKGGKVKIGPTTIFNDEKLYFANVTRDTEVSIYDVKGRLLWNADVTDASKCIPQKEYLYIKPEVIEDLVDGLYIIVFKNNNDDPQIRKFNRISRNRK